MFHQYSKLQQKQLLRQPYYDTQQTYLLIYAPGCTRGLAKTLPLQLHRKFRLVDKLDEEALASSAAGVVLMAEDAEWMSTTLSYFAHALSQGADFAFCDGVFGFEGATALYRAPDHPHGCRCAALSRSLLERCLAKQEGPVSARLLIERASALAKNPCHIPQALVHYRRELSAGDVFSAAGRRVVVFSHELDMTGAPIVLVSAVPVLRRMGFEVVVVGPEDGGSLPLFVEAGATAVTSPGCVTHSALWGLAMASDLVIANTVVEVELIRRLNGAPVPVLWWLHDAFAGYPYMAHRIPKQLEQNVFVCAVGSHATAAMHSVRPEYEIHPLIYGLPDYAREEFAPYDIGYAQGKPLFVNVGAFEPRKGQDILADAIRLLPEEIRAKAAFLFVGKGCDKQLMAQVRDLTEEYPENVFYVKRLERDEIKSLMTQCACVVCSSRDDPMPTFVTEGLIFGKPAIVSEHTGTAGLLTEGVDGFIYREDDPAQLAARLEEAILHPEQLAAMAPACRSLYERFYSKQAFEDTLSAYVRKLTKNPKG